MFSKTKSVPIIIGTSVAFAFVGASIWIFKQLSPADKDLSTSHKLVNDDLAIKNTEVEEKEPSRHIRNRLDNLVRRKFFYCNSAEIYGGIAGVLDYGPIGCEIKENIISLFRKHFIQKEKMVQVECAALTPEKVLVESGHVEKFCDLMVKDKTQYKKVETTKDQGEYKKFNLLFSTYVGPDPTCQTKAYLRPETAQGIFLNFARLYDYVHRQLPFAAVQIGPAYRNEISPRNGLLRAREFLLAEIQHFYDPQEGCHKCFSTVAGLSIPLLPAQAQMEKKDAKNIKLGDAVADHIISNQHLAYFIGKIYQFLLMVGVDQKKIRFRQHLPNEMAFYAQDCWDAECHTSYGWIECVGCADRSTYDLTRHSEATGADMRADRKLSEAKIKEITLAPVSSAIIQKYGKEAAKALIKELKKHEKIIAEKIEKEDQVELPVNGTNFTITSKMVKVKKCTKRVEEEKFVPAVIEPSFGVGRIMYVLLEHNFKIREGSSDRTFFSFPPMVAPYKCCVLPIRKDPEIMNMVGRICEDLEAENITFTTDASAASIGRRYARQDELGVPFILTVDDITLRKPHSVTLRDRDSMLQYRVPVSNVVNILNDLTSGKVKWATARSKYSKNKFWEILRGWWPF
ncbi:glycine--tRNA ligase-like [Artemia franciscana]|uniref:glycine--tRNA ligase n=1 Tax=Artemia franciscana TaxID=6661 RepID=A0AA88LH33_ARTSF|nr:hypothetical protein QYM36_003646 [Artemia franciscana]